MICLQTVTIFDCQERSHPCFDNGCRNQNDIENRNRFYQCSPVCFFFVNIFAHYCAKHKKYRHFKNPVRQKHDQVLRVRKPGNNSPDKNAVKNNHNININFACINTEQNVSEYQSISFQNINKIRPMIKLSSFSYKLSIAENITDSERNQQQHKKNSPVSKKISYRCSCRSFFFHAFLQRRKHTFEV